MSRYVLHHLVTVTQFALILAQNLKIRCDVSRRRRNAFRFFAESLENGAISQDNDAMSFHMPQCLAVTVQCIHV